MEDIKVSDNLYRAVEKDISSMPSYNYINISPESIKIANEWNRNNNVHPIIIPTTDEMELIAQWDAWQTLSIKRKIISNSKAIEIFGISNTDIYNYCMQRGEKKKELEDIKMTEIPIDKSKTEMEMQYLNTQQEMFDLGSYDNSNDIKMLIASGLNEMYKNPYNIIDGQRNYFNTDYFSVEPKGLTEAHTDDERYNMQYEAWKMGFCSYEFYKQTSKNQFRLLEMQSDYEHTTDDSVRESICEAASMLGGNLRDSTSIKLPDGVNIIDISNMTCNYVSESVKNSDIKPVFLIQLYSGKWYSKVIKDFTHGQFSHAAMSLDSDFKSMYSFMPGGFTIESIDSWRTELSKNSALSIHCLFITKKDYVTLTQKLEYYLTNTKNTKYAWGRLIMIMLGKPGISNNKLVCSQFVDLIFKSIGVDLTGKDSSLVSPNDFITTDINVYKLYDNDLEKFDDRELKTLKNKVNVLSGSVECDYKTATAQSAMHELFASDQVDLSLLKYCAPLFESNIGLSRFYTLMPYLHTYVADSNILMRKKAFNLRFDGAKLKNLFMSEE